MADHKVCTKCGVRKPLDDFYAMPEMRDGYRNDCKVCNLEAKRERYRRDPESYIRRVQEWRRRNPDKYKAWLLRNKTVHKERRAQQSRRYHLKKKYGISPEDFQFLVKAQGGCCAICGSQEDELLHVDHDHRTGRVRGLLCGSCNRAIGLFHESAGRFGAAERYLNRRQLMLACGDRLGSTSRQVS